MAQDMTSAPTIDPTNARGPTALLALIGPLGPCGAAQEWIRSLPETMPFAEMWGRCPDASWMHWIANWYGLKAFGNTSDEIRTSLPWDKLVVALANPPSAVKCDDCGEMVGRGDLYDGRCEDCDNNYVYCAFCTERPHRDNLCDHLEWSDAAGEEVGTGAHQNVEHKASFDRLLGCLGLKRAKELRGELSTGVWWTYGRDNDLSEAVDDLWEQSRDTDDRHKTEVGLIWLDTLTNEEALRPLVKETIGWIEEHLAAREAAIAADKRPRHMVRDGAGRYYVQPTNTWTAVREVASWRNRAKAHSLARLLRKAYPNAGVHVVHVLTPYQPKVTR